MPKKIRCWAPLVTELPERVTAEALSITGAGTLFHPYWLIPVRLSIKLPFMPASVRLVEVAADALNGKVSALPKLEIRPGEITDAAKFAAGSLCRADNNAVLGAARAALPAKLRMWGSVQAKIGGKRLVFKELRVFRAVFKNGAAADIALDSLTGEYGIVGAYSANSHREAS